MGIKKKNLSFAKAERIIKSAPSPLRSYYRRYLHVTSMEPKELDNVESFAVMKKWCKGKVLDIGCGLGYLTHYLKGCGADKNEKIISLAKELYPGLDFFVWGRDRIIADKSFDTVVCYNLIEHVLEPERLELFKKIGRILKENGRLILGYADPYNILQLFKGFFSKSALFDPTHIYNWPVEGFREIISGEFNIIETVRTSPFTKYIHFSKYFKGDILILCSLKKQQR